MLPSRTYCYTSFRSMLLYTSSRVVPLSFLFFLPKPIIYLADSLHKYSYSNRYKCIHEFQFSNNTLVLDKILIPLEEAQTHTLKVTRPPKEGTRRGKGLAQPRRGPNDAWGRTCQCGIVATAMGVRTPATTQRTKGIGILRHRTLLVRC
jgi:hypothetical protein